MTTKQFEVSVAISSSDITASEQIMVRAVLRRLINDQTVAIHDVVATPASDVKCGRLVETYLLDSDLLIEELSSLLNQRLGEIRRFVTVRAVQQMV